MSLRMRLILLGFFLTPGLALAKPKAPEAHPPVASWDMADDDLQVLLKTGTVEQISALPGVNAQGARFIIRLREGKAPPSEVNDVISREHVDKVVRLLEITSRPTFEEIKAGEGAERPVRLNLNTATAAQLAALDGVGPRLAEAIVALRTQKGGAFKRLNELTEVEGIDADKLARLKPHFNLGDTATHE